MKMNMKSVFFRLTVALLVGWFHSSVSGDQASDLDNQALKILTRNCASCHNQADHPGALFLNQARLNDSETMELITKLIESSTMPPAHANFKNTADGKTLLKWLKAKKNGRRP